MEEFSNWVKTERKKKRLTTRGLAAVSGVDPGTISRAETGQTQPTLQTAIRLAKGFDLTMPCFMRQLLGEKVQVASPAPAGRGILAGESVLAVPDVAHLLVAWHDPAWRPKVTAWVTEAMQTTARLKAQSPLYRDEGKEEYPDNIGALLLGHSSVLKLAVQYPANFAPEMLESIYLAGGLLLPMDLQAYVENLNRQGRLSARRFDAFALERLKLLDALSQYEAGAGNSHVLGMYWRAYSFEDDLLAEMDKLGLPAGYYAEWAGVVETMVILFRWWEHLREPGESSLADGLRGVK